MLSDSDIDRQEVYNGFMEGQSPEVSPPVSSIPIGERREQIYENIDRKITIVRDLWRKASSLPPVSSYSW